MPPRRTRDVALHDLWLDFTEQAGARFRKDEVHAQRINRLPVQDKSLQAAMTRKDAMLALWDLLPVSMGPSPGTITRCLCGGSKWSGRPDSN